MNKTPPTAYDEKINEVIDHLVADLLWIYREHEDDEVSKIQAQAFHALSQLIAEARIDEAKNAYNLMQSYLDDDMDSDDATYQLQVDLRERMSVLRATAQEEPNNVVEAE